MIDLPAGRYLYLDRRGITVRFKLSAVRAFQSHSLLSLGATIIPDYTPVAGYEPDNLTKNLG